MADGSLVSAERIAGSILSLRGAKVLLDADLAELYGVNTKTLVQAVRRNGGRFPADFMFQLTREEFLHLRGRSGTSRSWGGRRYCGRTGTNRRLDTIRSATQFRYAGSS
jgi:hypothetical protein